jgi:hypothetical protein
MEVPPSIVCRRSLGRDDIGPAGAAITATSFHVASGDCGLRNRITGVLAGCCARAASGHAATAPPSKLRNLRRFMAIL